MEMAERSKGGQGRGTTEEEDIVNKHYILSSFLLAYSVSSQSAGSEMKPLT
jgi:hypothetical protein